VTLSLEDVQRWDPQQIDQVASAAAERARTSRDQARELSNLPVFTDWDGDASEAAKSALSQTRTKLELSAQEAFSVAMGAQRASGDVTMVKNELRGFLDYAAAPPTVEIDTATSTVIPPDTSGWEREYVGAVAAKVVDLQERIVAILSLAEQVDAELAQVLNAATGGPTVPDPSPSETPSRDDLARVRASADAFEQVFGRPPTSPTDWATAEALNPISFDPLYQGTPPEIRVVKINPVPGQGVVRASEYIQQRDVTSWPPPARDFGNNRLANPNFDPENSKVTTYIDYENGIVVMRQNPSVELTDQGGPGEVRVGVPEAVVSQTEGGAVRIQYDAGNPFVPDLLANPPSPMDGQAPTVNGDLVFTPTDGGIRVDGTRTDYPSLEVYQDMPTGSTRTALIDAAESGSSLGPAMNLPFHHDVGRGGSAFEPFNFGGGWNPQYDVRMPLAPTEFGPVSSVPSIPPRPLPAGTNQF
jgi:hypothetical protein